MLSCQRGAALLAILAIIIVSFAVVLTAAISINGIRNSETKNTARALSEAKRALEGYALRQQPVGGLPCPDTDDDGLADTVGVNCSSLRGRLPYVTLSLAQAKDGSNTDLWYAIEAQYAQNATSAKNPSTTAALAMDGTAAAAIVIAPNREIGTQVRTPPVTSAKYLEGTNADSDLTTYSRLTDDAHNDQLLMVERGKYWTLVQRAILAELSELLLSYQNACGDLPWAAEFGAAPYNSVDTQSMGAFPFHAALPVDWNAGCAAGLAPQTWWHTHWGTEVYYSMCDTASPDCIAVTGDVAVNVDAVLIAPGVALGAQARPSLGISNYYELNNAVVGSPYEYRKPAHFDGSFNDVLQTIEF